MNILNYSIYLFLLISKILCQIYTLFQSDELYLEKSPFLNEIESSLYNKNITNPLFDNFHFPLYETKKKEEITFPLFFKNIDYGNYKPLIEVLIKDNKVLDISNISFHYKENNNILYPERVIKGNVIKNNEKQNNNLNLVNCSLDLLHYDYKIKFINKINIKFTKFQFFFQITLGLFNGNIYYMKNNTKDENIFIIDTGDCYGYIDDFFISYKGNENIKEVYLFNLIKNKTKICIFSLSMNEFNNLLNNFVGSIKNIDSDILDIKSYDSNIYLSLEGKKKIFEYSIKHNLIMTNTLTYNEIENDIISFEVLENTIYALEKKKGLIIFNKRDSYIINKLQFLDAFKIDYFLNPFTGYKFIGIYFNNNDDYFRDFFIELLVNNENSPLINKVLLFPKYEKFSIDQILTFDYFFTYIYDKTNKYIIMIKRGSINKIPFVSYKISFEKNKNIPEIIFPISIKDNKMEIGFFEKNDFYIIEGNFIESKLTCNFTKKGFYIIVFSQNSDFCNNFFNYGNDKQKLIYCVNAFSNTFYVKNNKNEFNYFNFFIICFFILIIGVFIYTIRKLRKDELNFKNKPFILYLEKIYLQNKNISKIGKKDEFLKDKEEEITIEIGYYKSEEEKLKSKLNK